jgi:hypothetical protein
MPKIYRHPPEYHAVPELRTTREFVYNHLLEYFEVEADAEPRPDGMVRGNVLHADAADLQNSILNKRNEFNRSRAARESGKIVLAREAIPKVLRELNILNIVGFSDTYERIVNFEVRVFGTQDGYKEEHAAEAFKYSLTQPQE